MERHELPMDHPSYNGNCPACGRCKDERCICTTPRCICPASDYDHLHGGVVSMREPVTSIELKVERVEGTRRFASNAWRFASKVTWPERGSGDIEAITCAGWRRTRAGAERAAEVAIIDVQRILWGAS